MSSDSRAGKEGDSSRVDAKTLLATNGGMITGILFFLTLSTFLTGRTSILQSIIAGVLTVSIVFIFAESAFAVIPLYREPDLRRAKQWMRLGLCYVPVYLALIALGPLLYTMSTEQRLQLFEEIDLQCAKNPELFNVATTPWKCSQFSPGSLAERCTKDPELFEKSKSECHQLIPPSS